MSNKYDYIITGAGCAGLSLLKRMMRHAYFSNKKILLIDKTPKNNNDRTWCFWETGKGVFEEIVHHRWQQINFYAGEFSARYNLQPYEYKMIRSIDLYADVLNEAKQFANIDIVYKDVRSVFSDGENVIVTANDTVYNADYIFNSIIFEDWKQKAMTQKNIYVLMQHFKGRVIECDKNIFDERIATFMDFRVSQNEGTAFVYVLPLAKNKALVEYTFFSENILGQEVYDKLLDEYISSILNIKSYSIKHTEFGVIPMTNYIFSKNEERIIHLGTAGNKTKGSSGYTFQFIQKHSDKIIEALLQNKSPDIKDSIADKRFHLYDSVLLQVLQLKKMKGDRIFAQLFKNNSPQSILKFLDNETSFKEELKIMNSVSLSAFLPAAAKEIFKAFGKF